MDISSNVLVFQKNPSWPEGRFGAAVIGFEGSEKQPRKAAKSIYQAHLGAMAVKGQAARSAIPRLSRAALALPMNIAGVPLVYGLRSATNYRVSMVRIAPWVCRNIPARHLDGALPGTSALSN
ncbi:MAG TPA: hypothetical protein VGL45_06480 [Bradyrhizobium sp.]